MPNRNNNQALPSDLRPLLPRAALVFRGYNVSNLGRTPELLETPAYDKIVRRRLQFVSEIASDQLHRKIDLVQQVSLRQEYGVQDYAREVAVIYAAELAQIDLLREIHGLSLENARLSWGYSLGEVVALAAAGATREDQVIRAPLEMAHDCASMADNVTMGVVFSRKLALSEAEAHRLCREITAQGNGTIAMSAILSPNTLLVLGQGRTVELFKQQMAVLCESRVYLRVNESKWPPLHTPLVRQHNVPDRASVMLETMQADATLASPPVFSLVSGHYIADEPNLHELLRNWVDRPQRLWDAVCETLSSGVQTVLHVGPAPNLPPATFSRLADNIQAQSSSGAMANLSISALRQIANRPWLAALLPQRASLLRVTELKQIVVEDWLLDQAPR